MGNISYDAVYDHLDRLIAIPSVSGIEPDSDQVITYCEEVLKKAGMHVKTFKDGGFSSLVATSRPDVKKPKLLLAAHLDVVPGDESLFKLRREDGRLYGRGVLDMKFAGACFLQVATELADTLADYDFGIMLTTDEETSGEHGVKYLLEEGYGCEVCLLPDGANNWRVEAVAKGVWRVEVTAKGRSAHGAQPWLGDSAIDKLLAFLHEATTLIPAPGKHADTTMVVSMLQGGEAANQVPDSASATLDIRFLGIAVKQALESMLTTAAIAQDVEITTAMYARPVELDLTLSALQVWEEIIEKVRGQPNGDYALSFGASDARFFAEHNIPSIVTYPTGEGGHSDHEWIGEKDLYEFYESTLEYVKVLTGKSDDSSV
jgi:succinyl-diaminopimelate desuccinylase